MPDLSPDTSIYQNIGQGQPGLGQILGIIAETRALNTQSALSGALKASGGDPNTALTSLLQSGNEAYVTPEMVGRLSELGSWYTDQAAKAVGGLSAKGRNIQPQDVANTQAMLAGFHVPPATIMQMFHGAEKPDGSVDPTKLALEWNTRFPGNPLPTTQIQSLTGAVGNIPAMAPQVGGETGQGGQTPFGFAPTSIPGAAEAGATPPIASAHIYAQDQTNSTEYPEQIGPLKQAYRLATELGPEGMGNTTKGINAIKNALVAVGADKYTDFDPQKTYKYQELSKYLTQVADRASAGGTDARLLQAVGGNPNTGMNQQAVLPVLRYIIGMRRMQQVGFNEYTSQYGQNAGGYASFIGPWKQRQDTRAYAFDLMDDEDKRALLGDLGPKGSTPERKMFDNSLEAARRQGLGGGGL